MRVRPGVDVVHGGAYLVSSRTPIPAARVEILHGCPWTNRPLRLTVVRTDAAGRYAFAMTSTQTIADQACAALVVYPSDELFSMVAVTNLRWLTPLR